MLKITVEFVALNELGDIDSVTGMFEYGDDWDGLAAVLDAVERSKFSLHRALGPDARASDVIIRVKRADQNGTQEG